jgi:hypothetical protein
MQMAMSARAMKAMPSRGCSSAAQLCRATWQLALGRKCRLAGMSNETKWARSEMPPQSQLRCSTPSQSPTTSPSVQLDFTATHSKPQQTHVSHVLNEEPFLLMLHACRHALPMAVAACGRCLHSSTSGWLSVQGLAAWLSLKYASKGI